MSVRHLKPCTLEDALALEPEWVNILDYDFDLVYFSQIERLLAWMKLPHEERAKAHVGEWVLVPGQEWMASFKHKYPLLHSLHLGIPPKRMEL